MSILFEHVTAVTMDPTAPVLHDAFVLVEGTAIGLISAAVAFGLVSGAYLGVLEAVSRSGTGLLSNLYFTLLSYRAVWAPLLIGLVASGAVLGGFGSAASVRKHLKV